MRAQLNDDNDFSCERANEQIASIIIALRKHPAARLYTYLASMCEKHLAMIQYNPRSIEPRPSHIYANMRSTVGQNTDLVRNNEQIMMIFFHFLFMPKYILDKYFLG